MPDRNSSCRAVSPPPSAPQWTVRLGSLARVPPDRSVRRETGDATGTIAITSPIRTNSASRSSMSCAAAADMSAGAMGRHSREAGADCSQYFRGLGEPHQGGLERPSSGDVDAEYRYRARRPHAVLREIRCCQQPLHNPQYHVQAFGSSLARVTTLSLAHVTLTLTCVVEATSPPIRAHPARTSCADIAASAKMSACASPRHVRRNLQRRPGRQGRR